MIVGGSIASFILFITPLLAILILHLNLVPKELAIGSV
jgi:hypothetical protein